MLKKVATSRVRIGMYIHSVEGSWLGHSLWKTRFVIDDEDALNRVRACGAADLWIDVALGVDVDTAPPVTSPTPSAAELVPTPKAKPATSMADELKTATRILERSKQTVTSLFAEARMGNAVDTRECGALVDQVVASVGRHSDALLSLCRLKTADEYTYMHSVAVCALMVSLGRQLGLDEAVCHSAGMAGLLHDIGKSVMPQDVLNKPGKLTAEERQQVEQHVEHAASLLKDVEFELPVTQSVLQINELMDGTGYPQGLKAEAITMPARVLAVVNAFCAMVKPRAYRDSLPPEQALSILAQAQAKYDQNVVQALEKVVRSPLGEKILRP